MRFISALVLTGALVLTQRAGATDTPLPDGKWWSLQPLKATALPAVRGQEWPRSEVDRFILATLEANGLTPSPEATRASLLRRVTYDMTGLPPTPEEVMSFLGDPSPDAYAVVVDGLLASPAYGEKWARHWLDVARYGESDGFEFDKPRPEAWRYRDWVIDALNADTPYDEFVRWQIAGDVLSPHDAAAVTATGFLVCGPYDDTARITASATLRKTMRQDELEDVIGTVGQVFLGLTVHCARCHDHKFDPVPTRDYYRLASCFAGLDRGNRLLPAAKTGEAPAREQTDLKRPLWSKPAAPAAAFAMTPQAASVAKVLNRGSALQPGETVAPGGLECLGGGDFGLAADAPEAARRKALAEWLTRRDNPLLARTVVNRVWHWHFGRGLVPTPNDLGRNGGEASHPELLDWLAVWLREHGWSLKQLHRLLITSATYRQSSAPRPEAAKVDGNGRLLWRVPPRRLSAEELRDTMLAVSGALNPQRGGPSFRDFRMENTANTMHYHAEDKDTPEVNRRSIYRMWARGGANPMLSVFDCPDPSVSTPARAVTITPLSALSLLNSPFTFAMADHAVMRLRGEAGTALPAQIERLHWLVFSRPPTPDELDRGRVFAEKHGLAALCRVVFNSNEFLFLP